MSFEDDFKFRREFEDKIDKRDPIALSTLGEMLIMKGGFRLLLEVIDNEHEEVSSNACLKLGKLGDRRALEPIINVFQNTKSEQIRISAACGLALLGDANIIDFLIASLKYKYPTTVCSVAESLGKLGDKRAINPLIDLLNHTEKYAHLKKYVVQAVCQALVDLKAFQAVQPLISSLRYADREVRGYIIKALENITGHSFLVGGHNPDKWETWWDKNKYKFR